MLNFQVLQPNDWSLLAPFFSSQDSRLCDDSMGAVFLWRKFFHTRYAIEENCAFLQVDYLDGQSAFSYPYGSNLSQALDILERHVREKGEALRFCNVPTEGLSHLRDRYPTLQAHADRDWYDYLYTAEDLINFPGKRFHGQKNHLNRFRKSYPRWRWEEITPLNAGQVKEFFLSLVAERTEAPSPMLAAETASILEYLDAPSDLPLLGGLLAEDEQILAFSLGSRIRDTLFVHIEKARTDCPGVYPAMVQAFAAHYATDGIGFINREEDLGSPGLRTAKLSYHPVSLLEKYLVSIPDFL